MGNSERVFANKWAFKEKLIERTTLAEEDITVDNLFVKGQRKWDPVKIAVICGEGLVKIILALKV